MAAFRPNSRNAHLFEAFLVERAKKNACVTKYTRGKRSLTFTLCPRQTEPLPVLLPLLRRLLYKLRKRKSLMLW